MFWAVVNYQSRKTNQTLGAKAAVERMKMKRIMVLLLILFGLTVFGSGCLVVPYDDDYGYHHHWDHDEHHEHWR